MAHDSHPNELIAEVSRAIEKYTLTIGALPLDASLSDLRDAIEDLDSAIADIRRAAVIFPDAKIEMTHTAVVDDGLGEMFAAAMMPKQIPVRIRVRARPHEDSRAIMSDLARLNGERCTVEWDGQQGNLDLSIQLAALAQFIDPYEEDR